MTKQLIPHISTDSTLSFLIVTRTDLQWGHNYWPPRESHQVPIILIWFHCQILDTLQAMSHVMYSFLSPICRRVCSQQLFITCHAVTLEFCWPVLNKYFSTCANWRSLPSNSFNMSWGLLELLTILCCFHHSNYSLTKNIIFATFNFSCPRGIKLVLVTGKQKTMCFLSLSIE